MFKSIIKTAASATTCSAMGRETIPKNAVDSKVHQFMSKVFYSLMIAMSIVCFTSCGKEEKEDPEIEVASIELDQTTLSLKPGQKQTLTATVEPDYATNKTVTWESSNTTVASVENGTVTAKSAGTAIITAKAGNQITICKVSVSLISFFFQPNPLELLVGSNAKFETIFLTGTNIGSHTDIPWISSNTSVVTVDKKGNVTAVATGTATITTDKYGEEGIFDNSSVLQVRVYGVDEGVTINGVTWARFNVDAPGTFASTSCSYGQLYQWNRKKGWAFSGEASGWDATDASGNLWESANDPCPAGWRVPTKDELSGLGTGTWTRRYLDSDMHGRTFGTSPNQIFLPAAGYRDAQSGTSKEGNKEGDYWSSDQNGSSKAYDYNFTETLITQPHSATRARAQSVRCVKTTTIAVTGVSLNKTTLALTAGNSETLTATVAPSNATDKTVTWISSNTSVATVDANGKVTAVKAGSATITAKAGDKTAACLVTVSAATVAVSSVSLNKTTLALTAGNSETLSTTVAPSNATDKTVTWISSNTSVATVDANGKVTAVKAGSATITAKAGDKPASCTVTVSAATVAVSSVSLNKTTLALTTGNSETLTATVAPSNATDKTVTWVSSNTSVATVDANGKVTAKAKGTATITAKAGDKPASCTVTVTQLADVNLSISEENVTVSAGTDRYFDNFIKGDVSNLWIFYTAEKQEIAEFNDLDLSRPAFMAVTGLKPGTTKVNVVYCPAGSTVGTKVEPLGTFNVTVVPLPPLTDVTVGGTVWSAKHVGRPGEWMPANEFPHLYPWNSKTGVQGEQLEKMTRTDYDDLGVGYATDPSTYWHAAQDPCPEGWQIPSSVDVENLYANARVERRGFVTSMSLENGRIEFVHQTDGGYCAWTERLGFHAYHSRPGGLYWVRDSRGTCYAPRPDILQKVVDLIGVDKVYWATVRCVKK